jgi:hypothetical protein
MGLISNFRLSPGGTITILSWARHRSSPRGGAARSFGAHVASCPRLLRRVIGQPQSSLERRGGLREDRSPILPVGKLCRTRKSCTLLLVREVREGFYNRTPMCALTHIEAVIVKCCLCSHNLPTALGSKTCGREDRPIFGRMGGSKVDNIVLPLRVRCG